ncbi:MAG: hypothetical protein HY560_05780 [Gemmatimonadetes bacterium]|nr:hypothetical protein [Gemmatimonadota bacterium]
MRRTARLKAATAVALLVAAAAHAQDRPGSEPAAPIRIVVFQFTSDSGSRTLASAMGRSLVRALAAQPAFQVMSNPRGARPGENAQYAVVGHVKASANRSVHVAVQLLEIERVQVATRDSVMIPFPVPAGAVQRAGEHVAGQLREWLRAHTAPGPQPR